MKIRGLHRPAVGRPENRAERNGVPEGGAHSFLPHIERHEVRQVTFAAIAFVCVAAGALISRAGGDALFLSHFGSRPLPLMYIAGAVATGLGTYGCIRASRALKTGHIAIVVGCFVLVANLTLFASFWAFPSVSRAGAYLLADVSVRIPIFLFWAFASEIFDARQSRRLFGVIGSAGTAACLPAGLLVGPLSRRAGAESLVLLSATLAGGFILSTAALMRDQQGQPRAVTGAGTRKGGGARAAIGTPQLASIAALAVITSVIETVVDFQFKTTAVSAVSSTALAGIFGTLYAVSSVASLIIQLLIVHRLLALAGTLAALCVLPGGLLLAEAGVLRFRSAGWVFATKALDVTLTTTVNGTARQLLYRGIRRESRLTARALADGLYLPLAIGLAGAGLGLLSRSISIRGAAAVAAVGCLIWLLLARVAHRAYVSGLIDSLKARQFGFSEEMLLSRSPALEAWLRHAFLNASDDDLIYLATVLPQLGRLVGPAQLRAALERDNPKVKVAVLQSLSDAHVKEGPALARPLSNHADPEVRRAAILAAAGPTATLADLQWLGNAVTDPEPRVRAAAAAVLANAADASGRTLGRERLKEMAASDRPEFRAAAAEALEHVDDARAADRESRRQFLARLLQDRSPSVVLAALETIRSRPDPALALPVLPLLGEPVLAGAAADALVAIGPALIDAVLPLFDGAARPPDDAVLANIPPVIERIGDARGLSIITRMLTGLGPEERTAVFRCYVQLLAREPEDEAHYERIDALVADECLSAAARLATMRRLGSGPEVRLARDAVSEMVACHIQNAFVLLAGRVRQVDMVVLHRQITRGSSEERSNAFELLENVLPNPSRELLLGILERKTDLGEAQPADEVPELISDPSEWIAAGAAWAAAELALVSCGQRLAALQDHHSPVVRETALFALERLGGAA